MAEPEYTDLVGHGLTIAADGTLSTTHPAQDLEECSFEAYVQSDWAGINPIFHPSGWTFIYRTYSSGQPPDWLGTKIP